MTPHEVLFNEYVNEMSDARKEAEAWWMAVVTREAMGSQDIEAAEKRVRLRWPFGPASHPYVLAVYRKYYIGCLELNSGKSSTTGDRKHASRHTDEGEWGSSSAPKEDALGDVPPSVFTLDWLFGKHESLRVFLADMVFSPLGIEDLRR